MNPELAWLGQWLGALLADPDVDDESLRLAVALAVLAIKREAVTADGFNVDADNEELARVAGLER